MEPVSIIAKNLASDQEKLDLLFDRMPSYADEIARQLLGRGVSEASDEELELSYREMKEALFGESARESIPFSSLMRQTARAQLAAEIAKSIVSAATVRSFLPVPTSVEGKCVYFRNAYSDRAFRVFSPYLNAPTASYVDSPSSACKEIYNDLATFAILPISSSKEGVIGGIARHIARYQLSPVMFCRVMLPGSDEEMTMGLYASYPMAPEDAEGLEAILFSDESNTASTVMLSADYLGCPAVSMTSLDNTQGFSYAWRIVFQKATAATLLPLWLLLRCEYPHHQLCGIWRTVTKSQI